VAAQPGEYPLLGAADDIAFGSAADSRDTRSIGKDAGLEAVQELRDVAQAPGLDLPLQPADQRSERLGLADAGARELVERQVHADQLLQVQLPWRFDGKSVAGDSHQPVRHERPVGLEIMAVGQEHRFADVAHEIQIRVHEVERELSPL
jgi:hypothetical protein